MKKYVFYALGEVMLVVIGILIAVQLGNWNNIRKEREEEQFLLQSLKEDFQKNLANLNTDFKTNKNNLENMIRLLDIINEQSPSPNYVEIDTLISSLFTWGTIDYNTGAIDDMKSSGKLQIITNHDLRNKLSEWPSIVRGQISDVDIMVGHNMNFLLPQLAKAYPLLNTDDLDFNSDLYGRPNLPKSKIKFDINDLYDLEIQGILYLHLANQDFVLKNDLHTSEFVKEVIALINENLKTE